MPTREQALSEFGATKDYRQVGARLGVPPGQAYLIATGLPADGGDTFPPAELDARPGTVRASTQSLVTHPSPAENPTSKSHVHEWISRIARADPQMQRAAQARDAVPGDIEDPEETDICTVLTRDHDQVTAMLKQLKTVPGATSGGSAVHLSRRKSIADMIAVALSQHEAAEQELFWPVVGTTFDDGEQVSRQALEQEQQGKDLLHALGQTEPGDEHFDELVSQLETAASKHVAYEDVVLLALRRDMSIDRRRELGDRFRSADGHEVGGRPADRRGKATSEVEKVGGDQPPDEA